MLAEEGARGLSMRGLARRLGVSHAAPKHHFGNKEALLAAIATEGFSKLADEMEAAASAASDDPVARFSATGRAYIRFASRQPACFRLMFQPDLFEGAYPDKRAQESRAFMVLVENARASVPPGVDLDVEAVALAAWSAVHGVAVLWLDGPLRAAGQRGGTPFRSSDEVADRVLGLFSGLLQSFIAQASVG